MLEHTREMCVSMHDPQERFVTMTDCFPYLKELLLHQGFVPCVSLFITQQDSGVLIRQSTHCTHQRMQRLETRKEWLVSNIPTERIITRILSTNDTISMFQLLGVRSNWVIMLKNWHDCQLSCVKLTQIHVLLWQAYKTFWGGGVWREFCLEISSLKNRYIYLFCCCCCCCCLGGRGGMKFSIKILFIPCTFPKEY